MHLWCLCQKISESRLEGKRERRLTGKWGDNTEQEKEYAVRCRGRERIEEREIANRIRKKE